MSKPFFWSQTSKTDKFANKLYKSKFFIRIFGTISAASVIYWMLFSVRWILIAIGNWFEDIGIYKIFPPVRISLFLLITFVYSMLSKEILIAHIKSIDSNSTVGRIRDWAVRTKSVEIIQLFLSILFILYGSKWIVLGFEFYASRINFHAIVNGDVVQSVVVILKWGILLTVLALLLPLVLYVLYTSVILSSICRLYATFMSFIRRPVYTLKNIPRNWVTIFCVDFFTAPEIIPGINSLDKEKIPQAYHEFLVSNWLVKLSPKTIASEQTITDKIIHCLIYGFSGFFIFIPSYIYRMSLKATFFVWMPLLWVAAIAGDNRTPIIRAKLISKSPLGRFITLCSFIFIAFLLIKIIFFTFTNVLSNRLLDLSPLLYDYISPKNIPIWQVAGGLNSLSSIYMYFWSGNRLIEYESGYLKESDLRRLSKFISSIYLVKSLITLYTSACLLYILATQVPEWDLPAIGTNIFPFWK